MNRSYYTGNSLSVLHSPQDVYDDSVPTSVHSPPTPQRLFDNTPSCSAISPQLLHRNTGLPAIAGPIRNATGEAMPTSFDVALTQLSFMELVQRCNALATTPLSTRLSVSISLADVAVQTTAPCGVSHDSSTQTPDQPGPSLSHDVAVQTTSCSASSSFLDASVQMPSYSPFSGTFLRSLVLAQLPRFQLMRQCRLLHKVLCYMTQPHNLTSRSSSLAGFSQTVLWIAVIPFASHRQQYRTHMWYPCRRRDLTNQLLPPVTAIQTQSLANASSSQCPTLQPTASTTLVGTHPARPAGAKRSASTRLCGNP